MSDIDTPKQTIYTLMMIDLVGQTRKAVPHPAAKSYKELLEYCNTLNKDSDTYMTVYVLEAS